MTTVYKLVFVEDKKRVSYGDSGKYRLEYSTEYITLPLVGKIFAFESLEKALKFKKRFANIACFEIWECTGKISKEQLSIIANLKDDIALFWEDTNRKDITKSKIPDGTILCDSLRLIKKIE